MNIPVSNDFSISSVKLASVNPSPGAVGVAQTHFQEVLDLFSTELSRSFSAGALEKFRVLVKAIKKASLEGKITPAQEQEFLTLIKNRVQIGQIIGYPLTLDHFTIAGVDLSTPGPFTPAPVDSNDAVDATKLVVTNNLQPDPGTLPISDVPVVPEPLVSDVTPEALPVDPFSLFSDTPFAETEISQAAEFQDQIHNELNNPDVSPATRDQFEILADSNQRYAAMLNTLNTTINAFRPVMPPIPVVFSQMDKGANASIETDRLKVQSVLATELNFRQRDRRG